MFRRDDDPPIRWALTDDPSRIMVTVIACLVIVMVFVVIAALA